MDWEQMWADGVVLVLTVQHVRSAWYGLLARGKWEETGCVC